MSPSSSSQLCPYSFVNELRMMKNIPILHRSKLLTDMAQKHATDMMKQGRLFQSVKGKFELQLQLGSVHVAQVIHSGSSLETVQRYAKSNAADHGRRCSERPEFDEYGMGVAVDPATGTTYVCELFRGVPS